MGKNSLYDIRTTGRPTVSEVYTGAGSKSAGPEGVKAQIAAGKPLSSRARICHRWGVAPPSMGWGRPQQVQ